MSYWAARKTNYSNYPSKHRSAAYHKSLRPLRAGLPSTFEPRTGIPSREQGCIDNLQLES